MITFANIKNRVIQELTLPSINDEILNLINQLTHACLENYNLIKKIKKVDFENIKKDLPNNAWQDLNGSKAVYLGLLSLGMKSQTFLENYQDKNSFEMYLIDIIYNVILDECFLDEWCSIQNNLPENHGLTRVIAPGESDISLDIQRIIFKYISTPEVYLDESSLFITPVKSVSFIVGEKENIKSYDINRRCYDCKNEKCQQKLIEITVNDHKYLVPKKHRLYDILVDQKIFFDSFCGGNHRCGRCKVTIIKDNESYQALACDTYCYHGLVVKTINDFSKIKTTDKYHGIIHKGDISDDDSYGIVFDVGTTTIVGGIFHLGKKHELQVVAKPNEQYLYGLDVISRISYSLTNKNGLVELNSSIIKQLNKLYQILTNNQYNNVTKIVIVGNPTMICIINIISLESLATYPFRSQVNRNIVVNAKDIGIDSKAIVTFISGASGFIGSDIISGLVSSKFYEADNYQLIIDLGTNGEVALGNKKQIYACSTAAGPAFEGAKISCGVPSIPGAINSISFDKENYQYKTINNEPAIGFCGSGIVDMVAGLVNNHMVNNHGMFINNDYSFTLDNKTFKFSQQDVRELQLAKSAIRTGIEILMKKANISTKQIESIYVSGGLGSNINITSAIQIGLLPQGTEDKVHLIGNSAYYGASLYLLYNEYQEVFNRTLSIIKVIDLNNETEFTDLFVRYLELSSN